MRGHITISEPILHQPLPLPSFIEMGDGKASSFCIGGLALGLGMYGSLALNFLSFAYRNLDTGTIRAWTARELWFLVTTRVGLPRWLSGKESVCNAGDAGSIHWRRKWQPALVFLPGKPHEQTSVHGVSKKSDMT